MAGGLFPDDIDDDAVLLTPQKPTRTSNEIEAAEQQIASNIKDVRYIVREYPVEVVVQKYLKGRKEETNEICVPDYQRELVWSDKNQSRFIESLLIGLPIPYLFVADVTDKDDPENAGRVEIIDGVQRIRTLARFLTGDLVLSDLERLSELNGFRFADLHPSRQRRFKRATLRLIELTEGITEDVRREMFDRINTGSVTLEAVEVRRGMEPGPFLELTTELASDPLLHKLAPIGFSGFCLMTRDSQMLRPIAPCAGRARRPNAIQIASGQRTSCMQRIGLSGDARRDGGKLSNG